MQLVYNDGSIGKGARNLSQTRVRVKEADSSLKLRRDIYVCFESIGLPVNALDKDLDALNKQIETSSYERIHNGRLEPVQIHDSLAKDAE